ncbi:hypothetical protein M9458_003246, partial [Cirrhinus mrigala]
AVGATIAAHLFKQAPGKMARSVYRGQEDGTRDLQDPPSRQGEVQANYHINLLKEWKEPPERKPESALMKDVEEEDGSEVAERHASV